MRPWNKAALEFMREQLGQLRMEDANMIKKLEKSVACGPNPCLGFLSPVQMQFIEAEKVPFQQMNKVIDYLKEMEDKYFEHFCKILEQCNFKLHADKLRDYAENDKRKFGKLNINNTCHACALNVTIVHWSLAFVTTSEAEQEAKIAAMPPPARDDSNGEIVLCCIQFS